MISFFLLALLLLPSTALAVSLAWDANTDPVDGYKVYYGTDQANLSQTIDVGTATTYDLDQLGLSENVTYWFSLSAYNAAGESPLTPAVMYEPADTTPPSPPTGFVAIIP
jgi:hypothetical protein